MVRQNISTQMITTRPMNDKKINYLKKSLNEVDGTEVLKSKVNTY